MKLFRNKRQLLITKGNLKRYLLYAIGEIILVMVGISLAFQVNNWNDNRIKQNAELRYYENIRSQIQPDKALIQEHIAMNSAHMLQFEYANQLLENNDRTKMDTLGLIIRNLSQYSDFDRQGNIYETLVNSGEIKLLRNHTIVDLLRILEEKYLYINRMENIHYDAIMTYVVAGISPLVKLSSGEIKKPDKLFDFEFQNLVTSLLQIMTEKEKVYKEAIQTIDAILSTTAKELGGS